MQMLNKIKSSMDMLSRILLLFVLFVALTIIRPGTFLTADNLSTVIFQQAPFTILMSFGMGLAIITKGIDKSGISDCHDDWCGLRPAQRNFDYPGGCGAVYCHVWH